MYEKPIFPSGSDRLFACGGSLLVAVESIEGTDERLALRNQKIKFDILEMNNIIRGMKPIDIFKALSNESRLQILKWLKEPEIHFSPESPEKAGALREIGVCVSSITEKLNMTQSTASQYLSMLQRAGLIKATRIGKWTYYKRDEKTIQEIADFMKREL